MMERKFVKTFCNMFFESIDKEWDSLTSKLKMKSLDYCGESMKRYRLSRETEEMEALLEGAAKRIFLDFRNDTKTKSDYFAIRILSSAQQDTEIFSWASVQGFLVKEGPLKSIEVVKSFHSSFNFDSLQRWQEHSRLKKIDFMNFDVEFIPSGSPLILRKVEDSEKKWLRDSFESFLGFRPTLSNKMFAHRNGILLEVPYGFPPKTSGVDIPVSWKTPAGDVTISVDGWRSIRQVLDTVVAGDEKTFLNFFGIRSTNIDFSDSAFRGKVLRKILTSAEKVLE